MLKFDHGRSRRIAGLVLAAVVAAGGIASAGAAQDKDETRVFEKRIVIKNRDGKDVIKRRGPGEFRELAMKCSGERFEVDSAGGASDKKENVKFFICTDKGESLLPALEKAVADLEGRDEMSGERKTEILKKLRAKIDELRARG